MPSVIDTLVDSLDGCVKADADANNLNRLLSHLRDMEGRQAQQVESMKHALLDDMLRVGNNVNASVAEGLTDVRRSVDTMGSCLREQVLSLMTTMDGMMRGALEKLSVEAVSTRVSGLIVDWLQVEIGSMRASEHETRVSLEQLEQRLHADLVQLVHTPIQTRHEHIVSVLSTLPAQVSALCMSAAAQQDQSSRADVCERLAELRERVDHGMEQIARDAATADQNRVGVAQAIERVSGDIDRLWRDVRERCVEQSAVVGQQLTQLPMLVKGVLAELLKNMESQASHTRAMTDSTKQHLIKVEHDFRDSAGMLCVVRKTTDDVMGKVDQLLQQLTKQTCNPRNKGQVGEDRLYEMLCDRLTSRDNYTVEIVKGHAHNCDIKVKRLGYGDVRIELKAHGEQTSEKVRAKEVSRFQSDMMGLNTHGVFVSLHSGIVGKREVEIEPLPTGKFAVYLSNNKYDVDAICDWLHVLYRLDDVVKKSGGAESQQGMVHVTPEAMKRVRLYLKDFSMKVSATKTHLKESISLLNELAMEMIDQVLMGQVEVTPRCEDAAKQPCKQQHTCAECGKVCRTAGALVMHSKVHRPVQNSSHPLVTQ